MCVVHVTQTGANASGVNGVSLKRNESKILKHGDKLELLCGEYIHVIKFDPPPSRSEYNKNGAGEDEKEINKRRSRERSPQENDKEEVIAKKKKPDTFSFFSGNPKNVRDDKCSPSSGDAMQDKWETIENGKLLIFTAKGVEGRSKVIVVLSSKFHCALSQFLNIWIYSVNFLL